MYSRWRTNARSIELSLGAAQADPFTAEALRQPYHVCGVGVRSNSQAPEAIRPGQSSTSSAVTSTSSRGKAPRYTMPDVPSMVISIPFVDTCPLTFEFFPPSGQS